MNTKNKVVHTKGKGDRIEQDNQSLNYNDESKTKKGKMDYGNKISTNYPPSNSNKGIKNFNNGNNFYKKNNCISYNKTINNNKQVYKQSDIRNENYMATNEDKFGDKKNKFNSDYNSKENNQHNIMYKASSHNNHYNIDANSSINGINYNNYNNTFNNTIKDGGNISNDRSNVGNYVSNMNDNNLKKINHNKINTNGYNRINNVNNYHNYGYSSANNNLAPNKILPHPAYYNNYMAYNPYLHVNNLQNLQGVSSTSINALRGEPNLCYNNNYNKTQLGSLLYYNNNCVSNINNTTYSNINTGYSKNAMITRTNISGINKSNSKSNALKTSNITTATTSTSNSLNSPNGSLPNANSFPIVNPQQVLDKKMRKLKISEKLNISNNILEYKDTIKSKLYNNLKEILQNDTRNIQDNINKINMNQAETEAALNIVNNNTNIKVETDNVYNNHPLNQLDKKNSVETLSNEESTGHSTNDSDRERYSLNNNKNKLVDFSMTQPYIPLNMSYEYSTRKILIPDAGDFSLKTNFKDRSLRSSKINSFTPRKNNQTINENNLISQNIRKLFRHDKNSFTTEKNKFNKFSHYQSHSPVNLKNSYSLIKNKDVIGNLNNSNLNNTIIRKNSSKYYEAPEAEKILKNLSHSCSIENNANTRTIDYNCLFEGNYNKSNLNVQSFNLLNHNANTANISLLSDTSSVSDNENKVLITVRIKTDAKTTKEVSIKKNQNIFTAAKNFCEENKMSPLLINSISHTIHKAISSINDIFNLSLCESNQNCLTDLHDLYSPSSSSEETEFNLKNQNCRYNNFSCITLLNSDDEDEFDKNNLLNENDLNWLNVTM